MGLTRAALRPDLSILTMAEILEAKPRVGYYFVQEPNLRRLEKLMELPVKDLQSHPVIVPVDSSVYNAIVSLFLEDIGTLFVNDQNGYLVGVVSRKDLLKVTIGDSDIHQLPVSVVMSRMPNIIVTYPEESFYAATQKLVTYKIDTLPVVIEEKVNQEKGAFEEVYLKVIGSFSKMNMAKTVISYFSEM